MWVVSCAVSGVVLSFVVSYYVDCVVCLYRVLYVLSHSLSWSPSLLRPQFLSAPISLSPPLSLPSPNLMVYSCVYSAAGINLLTQWPAVVIHVSAKARRHRPRPPPLSDATSAPVPSPSPPCAFSSWPATRSSRRVRDMACRTGGGG
jgi:hypothetical protein